MFRCPVVARLGRARRLVLCALVNSGADDWAALYSHGVNDAGTMLISTTRAYQDKRMFTTRRGNPYGYATRYLGTAAAANAISLTSECRREIEPSWPTIVTVVAKTDITLFNNNNRLIVE